MTNAIARLQEIAEKYKGYPGTIVSVPASLIAEALEEINQKHTDEED